MYLLDTNVLSELTRPRPDVAVIRRLFSTSPSALFVSEMTRYELRYGAALHPPHGARSAPGQAGRRTRRNAAVASSIASSASPARETAGISTMLGPNPRGAAAIA